MIGVDGRGIQDYLVLWTQGKHQRDLLAILTTVVMEAYVNSIKDNTVGSAVSANHSSLDFAVIMVCYMHYITFLHYTQTLHKYL